MKILVTGSAGHLGEALMRTLLADGADARGIDRVPSPFTEVVGDIAERAFVGRAMVGVGAVLHTATLHKPHVATHSRQAFVDTNVTGTLNLLEEAVAAGAGAFVFTSTTSAFGEALRPPPGSPAIWVDETLPPLVRNIYGASKIAAEDLCELMHKLAGLPVIVLRTSRFFPEDDDDPAALLERSTPNIQANEYLYRRVDLEDVVSAHRCALQAAARIGFGRYIVSATTPFVPDDCVELGVDLPAALSRRMPNWQAGYERRRWTMPSALDRVYDNRAARAALSWRPQTDFSAALRRLDATGDLQSPLAIVIGRKGYHRR